MARHNRASRAQLAQQTLQILESHEYTVGASPEPQIISIAQQMSACLTNSMFIPPGEPLGPPNLPRATTIQEGTTQFICSDSSTLEACRRHAANGRNPLALNFASARNPGGGFLKGSMAQEESLALSSGLYASLTSNRCNAFYKSHAERGPNTLMYSDAVILTPDCPVFRDDEGALLSEPYTASFITCAAPNLSAMRQAEKRGDKVETPAGMDVEQAASAALAQRAHRVLAVAAAYGFTCLVLGAYGCGCFGHDQNRVARLWRQLLDGPFKGVFEVVEFAVIDGADAFRAVFN